MLTSAQQHAIWRIAEEKSAWCEAITMRGKYATVTFNGRDEPIWWVAQDGRVTHGKPKRRRPEPSPDGTCRRCGDPLVGDDAEDRQRCEPCWYEEGELARDQEADRAMDQRKVDRATPPHDAGHVRPWR